MTAAEISERIRAAAAALAAPGADALAIGRQLTALASQIEHAAYTETTRRASGATPALAGDARLWRRPGGSHD